MQKKAVYGSASILKRIYAFVLDFFIIELIIIEPFTKLFIKLVGKNVSVQELIKQIQTNSVLMKNLTILLFAISMLAWAYFSFMEWKFNQTIGQMILGLKNKKKKKDISLWQTSLSNMFVIPFFPFTLLWIIDPLYMFYNGKQRLSEKIAMLKMVQKIDLGKMKI